MNSRSLRRHHAERSRRRVLRTMEFNCISAENDWWKAQHYLGRASGAEYWTARPGNPQSPGRWAKVFTHRRERRMEPVEIRRQLGEVAPPPPSGSRRKRQGFGGWYLQYYLKHPRYIKNSGGDAIDALFDRSVRAEAAAYARWLFERANPDRLVA